MYPAYTAQIPNTHANKKHYNNPFSWSDEGRPVPKPKNPWSHDPRLIYLLPLRLEEVEFHIGKWKRGKISMIIMHHHIYGFPQKKIQDQQNSGAHFAMSSSAEKKSVEILGKTIESAEVHYTKPEDEFRWGIGLNTKFRREFFFSRSQVHNLCSGVPLKTEIY